MLKIIYIIYSVYLLHYIKTWILLHIFFNPRYNYFSRIWVFFSIFKQKATGTVRSAQSENPGEGIVKTAIELDADMIIMGSRGLGTIRRTILGSVSDYVVHHANVPVVVCPPSWFRMWITRDWNYSYKSRQFFVCDRMQWNTMSFIIRQLAELHIYICFNLIFFKYNFIQTTVMLLCFYVFFFNFKLFILLCNFTSW